MLPYDPTILTAVQVKPNTIQDVLQTMQTIESVCTDADGLKWFNWLYLQVTQSVAARAATSAGFKDAAWLAQLDVQFARLYFSALRQSLTGQPTPACWQVLFNHRNDISAARIQFALAGINAHINHDLPIAIVATCHAVVTEPTHRSIQYADYTALNNSLDALVESAKQTLHVRLLGDLLPPVSRLEDTMAGWSVSAARESAWDNAELLWHLRTVPHLSDAFLSTLDGLTTVVSKALLVPVPLFRGEGAGSH